MGQWDLNPQEKEPLPAGCKGLKDHFGELKKLPDTTAPKNPEYEGYRVGRDFDTGSPQFFFVYHDGLSRGVGVVHRLVALLPRSPFSSTRLCRIGVHVLPHERAAQAERAWGVCGGL